MDHWQERLQADAEHRLERAKLEDQLTELTAELARHPASSAASPLTTTVGSPGATLAASVTIAHERLVFGGRWSLDNVLRCGFNADGRARSC